MKEYHGVWENILKVVQCLCGEGTFKDRLQNAAASSFFDERDLAIDDIKYLKSDLEYIFDWTKRNMESGKLLRQPDEMQRRKLVEAMLHVLIETTRLQEKQP